MFFDIVYRKRSESLDSLRPSPRRFGDWVARPFGVGVVPCTERADLAILWIVISLTKRVRSSTRRAFGGCLGTERR